MKKQIKILKLNKTKVSELSVSNEAEVKGGKSGNLEDCPTELCFSRPDRDYNCGISINNNCSMFVICNTVG